MFDDDSFEFLFGYHRPGYCFDDDYDHRWSYRSEKSGAAEKREEMVTQRFNAVKKQVESTLLEKTMVRRDSSILHFVLVLYPQVFYSYSS